MTDYSNIRFCGGNGFPVSNYVDENVSDKIKSPPPEGFSGLSFKKRFKRKAREK